MILPAEWLRRQLRELAADHGRALLVVLGVLWGALSLTVVLSFGKGFHAAMAQAIRGSGENLVRVSNGMTTQPHTGLPAGRWIRISPEDAPLIRERVPGVRSVSVEFISSSVTVEYRGGQINSWAHGVNASYGELRSIRPEAGGRFINARDDAERRRVVFLGHAVKERLFGSAPAVGGVVKLWGVPFIVTGVLRPKTTLGNYNGMDRDKIFIPASTFQLLRGSRNPSYLIVGFDSSEGDRRGVPGIRHTLGDRYRFDPADLEALEIWNQIADDRWMMRIVDGIQIMMGVIGVFGLLVALIGVANVMYVLVEERRREIGVRMAVGAEPSTIMGGFFTESLALTLTGGVLGLLGSAGVLWLFNQLPLDDTARGYLGEPEVSLPIAITVTLFLGIVGCAAGFFPARRAALLDPVAALREE